MSSLAFRRGGSLAWHKLPSRLSEIKHSCAVLLVSEFVVAKFDHTRARGFDFSYVEESDDVEACDPNVLAVGVAETRICSTCGSIGAASAAGRACCRGCSRTGASRQRLLVQDRLLHDVVFI